MTDRERVLRDLEPRSAEAVLEELADLHARRAAGEALRVPRVTVHLRTGRDFTGSVLKVGEDRPGRGRHALLHLPGPDPRSVELDALHLPLDAVLAVTVHDAPSLAESPAELPPPPTRFALKQRIADLSAWLGDRIGGIVACEISWDAVPESGEPLRALGDLIDHLRAIVDGIAGEPIGREALRSKLRKIWLGVGSHPSVALTDGTLLVTTTSAPAKRMGRDAIRDVLEKAL